MTLTLRTPAKLNLTLDILGEAPGGYHELDSVMLSVDLCDTLTLTPGGAGLRLFCSDPALTSGEDNLVFRAALAFFAHTGLSPGGLELYLTKQIPEQAGLAGGCADAAAALVGLNELYSAGLTRSQLIEIGLTVGSDLPFCLIGGCARAGGRGERLTTLPALPNDAVFVIAKPARGMSTRLAFELYDRGGLQPQPHTQEMVSALGAGDLAAIGKAMSNAFEKVLPLPESDKLRQIMLTSGALGAAMTGSGTSVSSLFADEAQATTCLEKLWPHADFACIARPLTHGPTIV
ncbi:MAG: 4-(cytidine 5'-diphospho)-2-C-methyl-D-erythritol kinase [Oscillospiraceae bacterium]|nr:4-(cytidine 5'-diphospho)-2-C-methyl-D-erythritol kinase [Oscillospiraceae bacterium]